MWGQFCLDLFGLETRNQKSRVTTSDCLDRYILCTLSVYMQARQMYLEAQTVEFQGLLICLHIRVSFIIRGYCMYIIFKCNLTAVFSLATSIPFLYVVLRSIDPLDGCIFVSRDIVISQTTTYVRFLPQVYLQRRCR